MQFHDIMLPDDYPPEWADRFYSEQYVLAAYLLAEGDRLDVELPVHYVSRDPELSPRARTLVGGPARGRCPCVRCLVLDPHPPRRGDPMTNTGSGADGPLDPPAVPETDPEDVPRSDPPFASAWRRARLSVAERVARGKEARTTAPRSSHGTWEPATDRPDPVALLEEQAASRVPELVPIRYGRMMASPFTFYRGARAHHGGRSRRARRARA